MTWKAVGEVVSRLGAEFSREDYDDARQEARLAFWIAWERKPGNKAYAYVSARNAVVKFIIRVLWGKNPLGATELESISHFVTAQRVGQRDGLPESVLRELLVIFLDSRKIGGERGMMAAARDVFICNALAQEWNNQGISQALGVAPGSVKKYRQRIQKVLQEEIERREHDDGKDGMCELWEVVLVEQAVV